jgi:hypothetical protein
MGKFSAAPRPLRGSSGQQIITPGSRIRSNVPIIGEKRTVFQRGFIPEPSQMPAEHTSQMVKLIYNILKGIILLQDKAKQAAALLEIKEVNMGLFDRLMTYYKRLTPDQIQFFIGPRPQTHADGTLAIWDHNRDNPVLRTVVAGEQPRDVDPVTLKPKSKLELPRAYGGIL